MGIMGAFGWWIDNVTHDLKEWKEEERSNSTRLPSWARLATNPTLLSHDADLYDGVDQTKHLLNLRKQIVKEDEQEYLRRLEEARRVVKEKNGGLLTPWNDPAGQRLKSLTSFLPGYDSDASAARRVGREGASSLMPASVARLSQALSHASREERLDLALRLKSTLLFVEHYGDASGVRPGFEVDRLAAQVDHWLLGTPLGERHAHGRGWAEDRLWKLVLEDVRQHAHHRDKPSTADFFNDVLEAFSRIATSPSEDGEYAQVLVEAVEEQAHVPVLERFLHVQRVAADVHQKAVDAGRLYPELSRIGVVDMARLRRVARYIHRTGNAEGEAWGMHGRRAATETLAPALAKEVERIASLREQTGDDIGERLRSVASEFARDKEAAMKSWGLKHVVLSGSGYCALTENEINRIGDALDDYLEVASKEDAPLPESVARQLHRVPRFVAKETRGLERELVEQVFPRWIDDHKLLQ